MKNIIILVFSFLSIFLISCESEKFLEEEVFTFLSPSNFYKTASDAEMAKNAAYASLQGRSMYETNMYIISEFASDVADNNGQLSSFHTFSVSSEDRTLFRFWGAAYQGINRANAVIERVPAIDMDEGLKNEYIAEARFIRALHYFNLIRVFGNIPLLDKETAGTENLEPTNVGTSGDVWQLIIADLKFAESNLLASYAPSLVGRATIGAASALLAKVYLTRSGYGIADEWKLAADKAKEVMNMGYALLDVYEDIFDPRKKNGAEHIFQVQNSIADGFVNGMARLEKDWGYRGVPRANPFQGNSTATGTPTFFDKWDSIDKRFYATWLISIPTSDSTEISYPDGGMLNPHTRKWKVAAEEITRLERFGQNFTIMRYADVLLMHSEAENMANGPSAAALDGINQVLVRAGLPTIEAGSVSQEQLRQLIIDERAKELCFEFHTFFDYQRQNALIPKMAAIGITVEQHRKFFPIPQRELDTNPNLKQNNGY